MILELVSEIAAVVSAVASVVAVVIAYLIFRRQRNISLLQQRMEIIKEYDHFLYDCLTAWEWEGSYRPIEKYPTYELVTLFGPEFAPVHLEVLNAADYVADCNAEIRNLEQNAEVDEQSIDELRAQRSERIENTLRFYHEVLDQCYGEMFKV